MDSFDTLGRSIGAPTTWINNFRGSISEALFVRRRGDIRLPNPEHGGVTKPDGYFDPGERPGSTSAVREYLEHKSDLITGPPDGERPYGPGVAAARDYAADAALDWPAVRQAGGVMVIEFARPPGNEATRQAMLQILFANPDHFRAVRFGGGPWIERAAWVAAQAAPAGVAP
jgi:hypothetical protein